MHSVSAITKKYKTLKPDDKWSFSEPSDRHISNSYTHSYHRYPAKFIPQIVRQILKEYAKPSSVVCDPFGGCGTTLLEAKTSGHSSIGFDINPVAHLITESKLAPIQPDTLQKEYSKLKSRLKVSHIKATARNAHPKLKYWFPAKNINKLNHLYSAIRRIKNPEVQRFFLCGFSHILKNCSIWLMKSIKPTRDLNKSIPDPLLIFDTHIKSMIKKNADYYNFLAGNKLLRTSAKMKIGDARKIPLKENSVDIIITSPPYVTSYEYADLHQLSLLWFEYTKNLSDFRKQFIGTKSSNFIKETDSLIGQAIVEKLSKIDKPLSSKVNNYFTDMERAIREMYRIVKPGGHVSIIIGNTNLKRVEIKNAEVAHEQMIKAGFKPKKIIKRKISFQMIAPWRDKTDGRFTSKNNENKKKVYQYEYIIVMEK